MLDLVSKFIGLVCFICIGVLIVFLTGYVMYFIYNLIKKNTKELQ